MRFLSTFLNNGYFVWHNLLANYFKATMNWNEYMNLKKQKLADQFNEFTIENNQKPKSDIFKGISVFVNGLTNPSADEIKKIMSDHNGTYHVYYDSKKTDFIIASNLAESKIKQIGRSHKVVSPEWITNCLSSQKLIDYRPYLLYASVGNRQINEYLQNSNVAKDAKDTEFLNEFYKKSRLHHISSLAATFKQLIVELKQKSDCSFPEREKFIEFASKIQTEDSKSANIDHNDNVIMHIDIDCFFVSVSLIKNPQLSGLPVAVAHAKSNNAENKSMSEIASCSYEARNKGIKNGMLLGEALKLCPELKLVPYEFESYRKVGYKFYHLMSLYTLEIEAVSCDEMFVNITELLRATGTSAELFATYIRSELKEVIKCNCSAGLGSNKLLARLATKIAKPNGQFFVTPDSVEHFMKSISVDDLPGVGYVISDKLRSLGVENCGQLKEVSLGQLKSELGAKVGETVYYQCRGVDNRIVTSEQVRKSVSAEVNYGIRFEEQQSVNTFLNQLCDEVTKRLTNIGMSAKCVTVKIMVRMKNAPIETAKFLGHGMVDKMSKSYNFLEATFDAEIIKREVHTIYKSFNVEPINLRGLGIQLSRLEKSKSDSKSSSENVLRNFLSKKNSFDEKQSKISSTSKDVGVQEEIILSSDEEQDLLQEKKESSETSNKKSTEVGKRNTKKNRKESVYSGSLLKYLKKDRSRSAKAAIDVFTLSDDDDDGNDNAEVYIDVDVDAEAPVIDINESVICLSDEKVPSSNTRKVFNIYNDLTFKQYKDMFNSWISNETQPQSSDVIFFAYYLSKCVQNKYIERAKKMLDIITQLLETDLTSEWISSLKEIVDVVQQSMMEYYDGELFLTS